MGKQEENNKVGNDCKGEVRMIENFKVRKEIFEDTAHERCHFELTLDGKEYQGYYDDETEEVSWFQMQPDQEDHAMDLKELDEQVKERVLAWKANQ